MILNCNLHESVVLSWQCSCMLSACCMLSVCKKLYTCVVEQGCCNSTLWLICHTQFCAIGVWYKPRHIETTHVACTCMHTSYACTQQHMHFDINSCLVACAYTWTSIAHSISGSANWTSEKNTFQHAIVTINKHTIIQLTCVTDNWTAHSQCMLHKKLIYCSHMCLLKLYMFFVLCQLLHNEMQHVHHDRHIQG